MERTIDLAHHPEDGLSIDPNTAQLAVVGTGKVGSTLARSLVAAGWKLSTVMGSSPDSPSARRLAQELHCQVASSLDRVVPDADIVMVCVPDSELDKVIQDLALAIFRSRTSGVHSRIKVAGHTSGSSGTSVLQPLASQRIAAFAFHPVVSIADPSSSPRILRGRYAGITASPDALSIALEMAHSLGMHPLVIAEKGRSAYHLACSIASNFLVTLVGLADNIASSLGIEDGAKVLLPLVESTVDNLKHLSPQRALTGPIARGDVDTIAAHLAALDTTFPEAIPCYIELAAATLEIAPLDETKRTKIASLLSEWKVRSLDQESSLESSSAMRAHHTGY